jgi:hypothetical protein
MQKSVKIMLGVVMIATLVITPIVVFAGGDQNTNRGSEGEQIGEPAPDPAQTPEQPRTGDPNPDEDNVPIKGDG